MDRYTFTYTVNSYKPPLLQTIEYLYSDEFEYKFIEEHKVDNNTVLILNLDRDVSSYLYSNLCIDHICKVLNKGGSTVLDYSFEADTAIRPSYVYLYELLKEKGVETGKLFLSYNNSKHRGLSESKFRDFKIKCIHFPYFLINTSREMDSYVGKGAFNVNKDKDFLCLNRRVGIDKFKTIHKLVQQNLLHKTNLTFIDYRKDLEPLLLKKLEWKDTLSKLGLTVPMSNPRQLEEDIEYGKDLAWSDEHLYRINPEWYYKSKVNIVIETWFEPIIKGWDSWDDMIHITEKTWKPIYLGVPFVVIGTPGHLSSLRSYGFKTFENVIDESYDLLIGDERRDKALQAAIHLAKLYDDPKVIEVCEHNSKLIKDLEFKKELIKDEYLNYLFVYPKKISYI